jgi:hypothetical protein
MKKLLWVGAAVVGVIVVGVIALAFLLDTETVGQKLLSRVSEASGMELSASSVSLGIFSGIELEDVTASGRYARGDYQIRLSGLIFRHQLGPLLSGNFVIDQVLLDRPEVEVVVRHAEAEDVGGDPGPAEAAAEESGDLRLEVRQILIRDGSARIREEIPGREPSQNILAEGLQLTLRDIVFDAAAEKPIRRLSGRGEVEVERLQPGELVLRDVSGQVRLQDGVLEATDLFVMADQGELRAQLVADFNPVPFTYQFSATGDPLNVNRMAGLEGGSLGPGRLEFSGSGSGSNPEDLTGGGLLHLRPGQIPAHPVIVRAEQVLGFHGLAGSEYQATDARFEVEKKQLRMEGFSLTSPQLGLNLAGTAELDGPLDLALQLRVKQDQVMVPGVPPQLLAALADREGWVVIPLKVEGDPDSPRVTPDTEALLSQAGRGIFQRFGGSEEQKSPLERLLNRPPGT